MVAPETAHNHRWLVTEDTKIRALARYLAGATSRPEVWVTCACGAEGCKGKVPTRKGNEYGCALALGHDGLCANELIPRAQRYW